MKINYRAKIYTGIINEINKLPYKKITVKGIIEECLNIANQWRNYFKNYKICSNFNNIDRTQYQCFGDFNDFYCAESSILFCAIKRREGSDIPNVVVVYLWIWVEKHCERVFIQCGGAYFKKGPKSTETRGLVAI